MLMMLGEDVAPIPTSTALHSPQSARVLPPHGCRPRCHRSPGGPESRAHLILQAQRECTPRLTPLSADSLHALRPHIPQQFPGDAERKGRRRWHGGCRRAQHAGPLRSALGTHSHSHAATATKCGGSTTTHSSGAGRTPHSASTATWHLVIRRGRRHDCGRPGSSRQSGSTDPAGRREPKPLAHRPKRELCSATAQQSLADPGPGHCQHLTVARLWITSWPYGHTTVPAGRLAPPHSRGVRPYLVNSHKFS